MRDYTPDSYAERVQRDWYALEPEENFDWSHFPRRTEQERRERYVSDVERAAITLLVNAEGEILHPLLRLAILRTASDAAYIDIPPGPDSATDDELTRMYGTDPDAARRRFAGIIAAGYTVRGMDLTYPADSRAHAQYRQELDRAVSRLLWAVRTHRARGEEGIETETTLRRTGLSVTSSLAAAARLRIRGRATRSQGNRDTRASCIPKATRTPTLPPHMTRTRIINDINGLGRIVPRQHCRQHCQRCAKAPGALKCGAGKGGVEDGRMQASEPCCGWAQQGRDKGSVCRLQRGFFSSLVEGRKPH